MTDYIYYELHRSSSTYDDYIIKNANILLNKPETNSDGIYSFRHMTRRVTDYLLVDQVWADLTKMSEGIPYRHEEIFEACEILGIKL